jgi:hypothetical protein
LGEQSVSRLPTEPRPTFETLRGKAATRGLRQWRLLRDAAAPVLSAPALVIALTLMLSIVVALVMQFGTSLYDDRPSYAYMHAALNAALCVSLAVVMLLGPRWHRAHLFMLVMAGFVLVGSLWCASAKLQYRHGLLGDSYYALPHQAFHYDAPFTNVMFKTTDGIQLQATMLGRQRSRGVVIYPCWRTNRDAFSIATLAQWLANDMDVLVVDPRGQGESGGAKTPDGQEKFDVLAAVAFLRSTGHTRVGVLTEEDGALAAVQAGTLHQGIDSMAIVAPLPSWGESLGQEGRFFDPRGLPGRFYWRMAAGLRLAPGPAAPPITEAVRYVAPTPILFTGCKAEPGGSIDQLHLAAGEPKSLIVLHGEGRPVTWTHFAEYYQTLDQWFELTLRTPTTAAPDPTPDEGVSPP